MQLWLLILQEWCLLVCSCFVIMRLSYPHKGRGGALNGDTKNSCEGDHTSSLRVATPSPRQRGEGVATHGLAFYRRSLSPFFLCRWEGAVTRRLPHQVHEWMQQFKTIILQLWAL